MLLIPNAFKLDNNFDEGQGPRFVSEGDQLYLLPVRGCETPESVKMKSGLVALARNRSVRVQPGDGTGLRSQGPAPRISQP